MAVTTDKPAPYATTGAMLDIIHRFRDRGMAAPITNDVLVRAGVSVSLAPRTLQSLQVLELVDKDGMPTATFEGLRLAPTDEYQSRLEEWLKGVYADAFSFVDPATDTEERIRDAFRGYAPNSQQDRMVKLFIGLCEEAGIRKKTEKESKPRTRTTSVKRSPGIKRKASKDRGQLPPPSMGNLPPAIAGLVNSLPSETKGWTQEQRDKFVTTFEAVLDFCYPIVEESENDGDGEAIEE